MACIANTCCLSPCRSSMGAGLIDDVVLLQDILVHSSLVPSYILGMVLKSLCGSATTGGMGSTTLSIRSNNSLSIVGYIQFSRNL